MKLFSFRSDKIISVSKVVEAHLLKNYPHTKFKCTTIYNCIEESFYAGSKVDNSELRKSLGYTEADEILLFAGRISKIKGCDILIEAFKKLPSELNAKLLMIGSISEPNIKSLLERNRTDIKLLEPKKDIRAYYEISNVIVLPSVEDPFPYVMLEAGAMKKPFIGTKTGGIAEFIEDGVCGLLIEPGDSDKLADKIVFLINNPSQSELIANALYEKVKQECDGVQYFERLHNIYNQLRY
jgi:glycosyltransferase involved in cell wall biosynthesis